MKRFILLLVLGLLLLGLSGSIVFAQSYPLPTGYVSDFAYILSQDTIDTLEARLVQLQKDTTAELAVVTVDSLEGDTIEGYAVGLFEYWGIGKASQDNGVLFLIAPNEHKVRIEVGYGFTPVITNGRSGRLLDTEVLPYFKNYDYDTGVINGVLALEKYMREGTPPSFPEDNPVRDIIGGINLVQPVAIGLGIVTIYLAGFMARTRSFWFGGVWGVVAGVILGLVMGKVLALMLFPIGFGLFGVFFDFLLSKNYKSLQSGGHSTSWGSSWGGFRGGGSSGGGGSSFGGFGGGHSGGGGASRGW